jgi:putative glutathione S-transferase
VLDYAQHSPTICKENEMGLLIDGRWHDQWYDTSASGGRFVRRDSVFRNWVTTDGTPGPTGVGGYRAEAGRYHLYVSLACPWAHRTLIFRGLKGLTPLIDVSVVHWLMAEQGWSFAAGDGVVPDPIGGAHYLHEVYTRSDPTYSGHVTVPVLWDKKTGTIVNNERYHSHVQHCLRRHRREGRRLLS